MSAQLNNLKQIFTNGREKSVKALVSDICKKYEAYLVSGRDKYDYSNRWSEPGYFMSPYHMNLGNDKDAAAAADTTGASTAADTNVTNGWVHEPEMKAFMLEVVNALEKLGIYATNYSCGYESQPEGNVKYMIVKLTVSLVKVRQYTGLGSSSCSYRD